MDGAQTTHLYKILVGSISRLGVGIRGGTVEALSVSLRGGASSADLGGSSNYSAELTEGRSG